MSETTADSPIITEKTEDGVGLIRLNRPKALNALNYETMVAVVEAAEGWERDESVSAIVLTGSEKAFAAGADIKEMASKSFTEMYASDWFAHWQRLTQVRLPIIAAVNGYALGGGCELAMMCDILVAGEGATFGQPEINLGVLPGMGGSQRLTRAIGKAKAMDMILTARNMGAEEAERAGLVSRVVPDAEVLDTARDIAASIAQKSRPAAMMAKEAVAAAFETPLAQGLAFERRVFHSLFATHDQAEGMAAFSERRSPNFENR
ncbi:MULTISPECIES: enoyl-CoA hydratase [Kocuria]|uniref:enoyl-CoA hydratase n=1 Tax=Kocuria TaxID=57493 RepID=UPI00066166CA|nr:MULTISPECIES: enoyl-CoA hydratase [Kocuria]MCT1367116.1 enoyl-CoA hydratase [Rothia sp. p3-SID1597]RUQ21818.1 enoyl-CoA hydratase [Kocuria sp. HSID16901]